LPGMTNSISSFRFSAPTPAPSLITTRAALILNLTRAA
jgi:hypothetical protein